MSTKPFIWLDSDPGIDDSWAIAAAASQGTLLGVSAVAGNVPLSRTYGNALRFTELLGQSVPVIPGAENPLLEPLITAQAFHGESGTGNWQAPDPQFVQTPEERVWSHWARHASDYGSAHLVATGPLTNLAITILAHPVMAQAWGSVTCMCGALPGSQVDKAQEFNVYVDPHAADVVFHWTTRLQILGINVAHRALLPVRDVELLKQYGVVGEALYQMLGFYSQRSRGEGGDPLAFPIDDVAAVAAALQPDLYSWTEMPLAVVREGPLRGTVVISPIDLKRQPVRVAVDVNTGRFREWVWDAMATYRPEG